jgi:hypothetical protein
MIRPEVKEILGSINGTPFGRALQEFLDDQFEELNDVQACTSWEDTVGRQHAIKILENLFSFMNAKRITNQKQNTYE